MGLAPGTLVAVNATNQSLALAGPSSKGLTAAEDLYRGADTLAYGDNKPSEDAIDRVSSKINQECVHLFTTWGSANFQSWQKEEKGKGRQQRASHLHQRAKQGLQQKGRSVLRQVYQRVRPNDT